MTNVLGDETHIRRIKRLSHVALHYGVVHLTGSNQVKAGPQLSHALKACYGEHRVDDQGNKIAFQGCHAEKCLKDAATDADLRHIIHGITPAMIRGELFGAAFEANPVESEKDIWKKWLEIVRDTKRVLPHYYQVLGTGAVAHCESGKSREDMLDKLLGKLHDDEEELKYQKALQVQGGQPYVVCPWVVGTAMNPRSKRPLYWNLLLFVGKFGSSPQSWASPNPPAGGFAAPKDVTKGRKALRQNMLLAPVQRGAANDEDEDENEDETGEGLRGQLVDSVNGKKKRKLSLAELVTQTSVNEQESGAMGWRDDAIKVLGELYPLKLAESWDNVGVLIDALDEAKSSVILVTNDLTEKVLAEALEKDASMIVTYHPRPFVNLKRLQRGDVTQRIILRCVASGILVYSPHTACDSAAGGVNCWLAEAFPGISVPIEPTKLPDMPGAGSGRMIRLKEPVSMRMIIKLAKKHLNLEHVRVSLASHLQTTPGPEGFQEALDKEGVVGLVGVQAGSGGSVLKNCVGAEVWITGEMGHHEVLAAAAEGISVVLTEHTNTERGYLPLMAKHIEHGLKEKGHKIQVMVSAVDADPLNVA